MTTVEARDELIEIAMGHDIAAASRKGQRAERAKLQAAQAKADALQRRLDAEKKASLMREVNAVKASGAGYLERAKKIYQILKKYGG